MIYTNMEEAVFLSRPNRFIAHIRLLNGTGETEVCHVKNTGRCRELLIPGARIFVQRSGNPARKTKYDLIVVEKGHQLINMDSQAPNRVAEEWLRLGGIFSCNAIIRREVRFQNSRFDLYVEDGARKAFIEVKGVTLEENQTALFPDAPTERGVKHIRELITCHSMGYEAYLLFVIQMKGVSHLEPNDRTHAAFGDALQSAYREGVALIACDCLVTENSLVIDNPIPIKLSSVLHVFPE